jgi:ribokinase
MNNVLVAGSINMDVVVTSTRHPLAGESVQGKELYFFPGGKGANQAVASAKLGSNTVLIGKLGSDGFADTLSLFLQEQGINVRHVSRTSNATTGAALIVVAETGEKTIVSVPGANSLLGREEIEQVTVTTGDILLSQFQIPFETILYFFTQGKAVGARLILNPAPAKTGAEELLRLADILVMNETEMAFYLGYKEADKDFILSAARELRATPEQVVIITLGANGAFILNKEEQSQVFGRKVDAVDTTGAGDCFIGVLASQLAKGMELRTAVSYANIAASICVQRLGAGPSMPTLDEVTRLAAQE